MKDIILSAMRPTGSLHLGHLSILKNWINLQNKFNCYFFIADYHALTTNFDQTKEIKKNTRNIILDWLAVGIDPEKSILFVQSDIKAHSELLLLLSMITPLSWLERCPTYKMQIEQFKNNQKKDIMTYGFLGYPLLQSSDILLYNANKIPVGKDQLPHIEMTREIARKFNYLYKKNIFIEPEAKLSKLPLILGTDGKKMSSSYNNQIDIMSNKETLTKKIIGMITDTNRIKKTDFGNPDICLVFSYHKLYNDFKVNNDIKFNCKKGKIGCIECKKKLINVLDEILNPYREKRKKIIKNMSYINSILKKGKLEAEFIANKTLNKVKKIMSLTKK